MPRAAAALLLWAPFVAAQDALPAPAFEAASVKPAGPNARYGGMRGGPGTGSPGQIVYSATTLRAVLSKAYGVERFQIEAPAWLDQELFDITAKLPPRTTEAQFEKMLQALLADRFKLELHRETKPLPVYALTVAKTGLKMKPAVEPKPAPDPSKTSHDFIVATGNDGLPTMPEGQTGIYGISRPDRATMRGRKVTMTEIVNFLKKWVDRPVVDDTGLSGTYDFGIIWAPDQMPGGPQSGGVAMEGTVTGAPAAPNPAAAAVASEPAAPIYAAVQAYLGLKLDPRKQPFEILVIDKAEKIPVEN